MDPPTAEDTKACSVFNVVMINFFSWSTHPGAWYAMLEISSSLLDYFLDHVLRRDMARK
jgi:hypothetical protein